MPQSFTCLRYHVIFSTKGRVPLIHRELQPRLWEYMGGILRSNRSVLLAAGGVPDHVHLLIGLNQSLAVADAVRLIKANSSGWIHNTFPDLGGFAWQSGYGAFSVSYSAQDAVKRYIADQESHHRTKTYKEEFIEFLECHGIPYDEQFLWD
jgi:putative transposase